MADATDWVYVFGYAGAIGLILLGLFALVVYRNLIRMILGLTLLEGGVNLFLIVTGYRPGGVAPILLDGKVAGPMVDPVPQALVLTAIVIGVGVQALALALAIKAYQAYNTLDTRELAERLAEASGTRVIDGIPVQLPPPHPSQPQLGKEPAP